MDPQHVTLPIAFVAGLLSFASPCVLPLVPAYMGYLGGTAVMSRGRAETWSGAFGTFFHALFFVLGFTAVFVLFGASATSLGRFLAGHREVLERAGGVLLVVFGMRLMGSGWKRWAWPIAAVVVALLTFAFDSQFLALGRFELGEYRLHSLEESILMGLVVLAGGPWGTAAQIILAVGAGVLNLLASFDDYWPTLVSSLLIAAIAFFLNRVDLFYAEKRLHLQPKGQSGLGRSLLFGVVFAAGWTPCIGPILAAILLVASQLETVGHGILLTVAYSLGLAIPFLIVGLAIGPLSKWLRRASRYLGLVSVISGVLLVLMGLLMFTESLGFLSQYGNFLDVEF